MNIGIFGYGNLGRGVEAAIAQNEDMRLVAVFTRRNPDSLTIATKDAQVVSASQVLSWKDKIDVMILCGGSATDLPEMTPALVENFHLVDSFDNHSMIPNHFAAVDEIAKKSDTTAMISCGWDPGMFSLNRLYSSCIS